jgi:protein-S-isoprenylcysteine O-methyltransferase Ste14
MTLERALKLLAFLSTLPAGATLHFFIFWRWFDTWRRHPLGCSIYAIIFAIYFALGTALYVFRDVVFAYRVEMPEGAQIAGWVLIALSLVLGTVADRQLGIRVRAFLPFFEEGARIKLRTGGAYAIVRHPIYVSGIVWQIGAFLVTGTLAVLVSCAVFFVGALWFTRQEERRLAEIVDDPSAYEQYRSRVGRLFPKLW